MATINPYTSRPLLCGRESLASTAARPKRAYLAPRWSSPMNIKHAIAVALLLALPLLALAQDDDTDKGQTVGAYTVHGSIEFGGRAATIDGNQATYDTFTNLHSGPRLLGQSVSMTAAPGTGGLFDSLFEESFGFGGDPNDLARLRVTKQKWYDFVGLYRRDQNVWDFNLFANPLANNNTAGLTNSLGQTSPFLVNSPHEQITTRNMGDFNLTLLPESKISVRLGYSRNNDSGLIDSSLHEANEIDLTSSNSLMRQDRYQIGVDYKGLERTTISFDQFYEHDHLDYDYLDNPFAGFSVNGVQINPGIALQPNSNMSSSGCVVSGALGYLNGGIVNPKCNNGTYYYNRSDVVKTDIPTSQLSLRSNYFRKLDITADGLYSGATSYLSNYNDVWSGVGTHGGQRLYQIGGPASVQRITGNADLGLVYHLDRSWSVSDKFRWIDWRGPRLATQTEFNCFPSASPPRPAQPIPA